MDTCTHSSLANLTCGDLYCNTDTLVIFVCSFSTFSSNVIELVYVFRQDLLCHANHFYPLYVGKLEGESVNNLEQQQLLNAVYRDAIRTDSDNPFFSQYRQAEASYVSQHFHQSGNNNEDNIQKLINIIVIYTLEHGTISYTQGMTDILSPLLYVMKNEADAYIIFAAMVERIKRHFGQWCSGTLHKLERFRHLCEILDPDLYFSLTGNMEEDAFVLFFGMVLIECRREFSFQDSFHLLETIWAGEACMKENFPSNSDLSHAKWARYMTYESPEVLQQVFENSGGPYSAVPLSYNISGSSGPSYQYSGNLSCSPSQPVHAFLRRHSEAEPTLTHAIAEVHYSSSSSSPLSTPSGGHSSSISSLSHDSSTSAGKLSLSLPKPACPHVEEDQITLIYHKPADTIRRSLSESNMDSSLFHGDVKYLKSSLVKKSASPRCTQNANSSVGTGASLCNQKLMSTSISHSESELYDNFSSSKVVVIKQPYNENHTEMSDMSSISSGTTSTIDNVISSLASINSKRSTSALACQESRGLKNTTLEQERIEDASKSGSFEKARNSDYTLVSNGSHSFVSTLSPGSVVDGKMTSTGQGSNLVHSPKTTNGFAVDHSYKTSKKKVSRNGLSKRANCGSSRGGSPTTNVMLKDEADVFLNFSDDANCVLGKRGSEQGGEDGVCDSVVEHSGMITSFSNSMKHTLMSRCGPSYMTAHKDESKSPQLLAKEATWQHQRLLSSPMMICERVTPTNRSTNTTPIHYDGEIPSSARVTPVAFFDTMDKLAKSAPSNRGPLFPSQLSLRKSHLRGGESKQDLERREVQIRFESELDTEEPTYRHHVNVQSECSEIEASIMSQFILTDDGAPRVTREESLSIPFYECYSLFICLSILVQNRDEIMRDNADFYRLSEILNAQAGIQDLDETLRVARELCRTYRKYQAACFKGSNRKMDCWLDDTQ